MNKKLQKQLGQLENMIGIQRNCIFAGDSSVQYMHGMLNGLICAHSVFAECNPTFFSRPFRKRKSGRNIRHKCVSKRD